MIQTISNNHLSVTVVSKGAELQSIYGKQNSIEYMWSGDPAYWGKKSPVLFPTVGELKNQAYTYNGQQYKLSRHGFARELEFELTQHSEDSLMFSLKHDEQTLAIYPFEFLFSVKYTLVENLLQVSYIVENKGNQTMYFSVGGHPAFKVPLVEGTTYEDYRLVFNKNETASRHLLSADGLIEDRTSPLLHNENVLPLTKELFANDAIVLKELASTSVSIKSTKTSHSVTVGFEGFPYLGIWEGKGGDFVCIEPWCGIADSVNASGRLEEKEGINRLQPAEIFVASFTIAVA